MFTVHDNALHVMTEHSGQGQLVALVDGFTKVKQATILGRMRRGERSVYLKPGMHNQDKTVQVQGNKYCTHSNFYRTMYVYHCGFSGQFWVHKHLVFEYFFPKEARRKKIILFVEKKCELQGQFLISEEYRTSRMN